MYRKQHVAVMCLILSQLSFTWQNKKKTKLGSLTNRYVYLACMLNNYTCVKLGDGSNSAEWNASVLNEMVHLKGHEISTCFTYELLTSKRHRLQLFWIFDHYLSNARDEHVSSLKSSSVRPLSTCRQALRFGFAGSLLMGVIKLANEVGWDHHGEPKRERVF